MKQLTKTTAVTFFSVWLGLVHVPSTEAGTQPYLGEMMMTAAVFCPRGWANADGELLPINQYQALYSLLGTTYGGDGRTTFALPDMRGRVPLHAGAGPGLTNRRQGEKGGEESHSLRENEMPSHSHALKAAQGQGTQNSAAGNLLQAEVKRGFVAPGAGQLEELHPDTVAATGAGKALNVMQPYLGARFCIALEGIFPSRP